MAAFGRQRAGGKPLGEGTPVPDWVRSGIVSLGPAFRLYATVDPTWGVLADHPWVVELCGWSGHEEGFAALAALANGPGSEASDAPSELAALARSIEQASAALPQEVFDRRRDGPLRAFTAGVLARAGQHGWSDAPREASASEVSLLCEAVGLESSPKLDLARRRWVARLGRWSIPAHRSLELAMLATLDQAFDGTLPPRPHADSAGAIAMRGPVVG